MGAASAAHNRGLKFEGWTYGGETSRTWRTAPGDSNVYRRGIRTVVLVVVAVGLVYRRRLLS